MKNNVLCIIIISLAAVAIQIHLSNAVQLMSPNSAEIGLEENKPPSLDRDTDPQPIPNDTTVAPPEPHSTTTTSPTTTVPATTVPTTTSSTTVTPKTTTPTTATTTTTVTPTPTTTVPSKTTSSTTASTTTATTIPTSTNATMPTSQATTAATTTTVKPTAAPSSDRRFDGPSFIGGIVLSFGMMAIGFVAWKFYKARTERNYHTL